MLEHGAEGHPVIQGVHGGESPHSSQDDFHGPGFARLDDLSRRVGSCHRRLWTVQVSRRHPLFQQHVLRRVLPRLRRRRFTSGRLSSRRDSRDAGPGSGSNVHSSQVARRSTSLGQAFVRSGSSMGSPGGDGGSGTGGWVGIFGGMVGPGFGISGSRLGGGDSGGVSGIVSLQPVGLRNGFTDPCGATAVPRHAATSLHRAFTPPRWL